MRQDVSFGLVAVVLHRVFIATVRLSPLIAQILASDYHLGIEQDDADWYLIERVEDLDAGTRRERQRIDQAYLILFSTEAAAPCDLLSRVSGHIWKKSA
jgi:hypothetical protein